MEKLKAAFMFVVPDADPSEHRVTISTYLPSIIANRKLDVPGLREFGDVSGRAQFSVKTDIAPDLALGFFPEDFGKFFGVFVLHAALDFLQGHLLDVLSPKPWQG